MMKTLVLYYTRTGSTKLIAETVAAALQADIEALDDPTPYAGATGYLKAGGDALTGRVNEIRKLAHDPAAYDLIVIGQPVWAARPVPAFNGFVKSYSLKGKKIALFVTLDGMGDKGCLKRSSESLAGNEIVAQTSFLRVAKNKDASVARAQAWAQELARLG
jgi:flavodoxin